MEGWVQRRPKHHLGDPDVAEALVKGCIGCLPTESPANPVEACQYPAERSSEADVCLPAETRDAGIRQMPQMTTACYRMCS